MATDSSADDDKKELYRKNKSGNIWENTEVDPNQKKYESKEEIGQCTVEEVVEDEPTIEEDWKPTDPAPPSAPLPEVRKKTAQSLPFSEKKFAHLPARESQMKEAPYPKSKKIDKQPNDQFIDIEDKDPLWLKDKGDHFYKRNDYHSALNAYSKSISNDQDFLMARLNRATTFIKMRWYQAGIDECNDIERIVNAIPENDKVGDEDFYMKMLGRNYLRRAAAQAWLAQYDVAIEDYKRAMDFTGLYSEAEIEVMKEDIKMIELRKES